MKEKKQKTLIYKDGKYEINAEFIDESKDLINVAFTDLWHGMEYEASIILSKDDVSKILSMFP
ncbi:MAG: hypothetical protein ACYCSB_02210 [bacterium]